MSNDFQNPNEDPGLQKRLLLVFAITFAIILATQPLLRKFAPQLAPEKQEQPQQQPAPPATPPAAAAPAAARPAAAASAPATTKQAAAESEIVVENGLYKITFTNRGALVKSWVLKDYRDDKGKPLELVNQPGAEKYGYPLSLWAYDEGVRTKLNSALYLAAQEQPLLKGEEKAHVSVSPAKPITGALTLAAPATISFEYADGDLSVRKSFHFDHSYVVQVETEVTRGGANVTAYPAWPAGFGDQITPSAYAGGRVDYLHPRPPGLFSWAQDHDVVERTAPKNVSGGATVHGPFQWAGAVDQYFAAIFLPGDPEQDALVMLHNQIEVPADREKPDPAKTVKYSVLGAAVGNPSGKTSARLFVGPKAIDVLASVHTPDGENLEGALDFGWFGFIAKPLFLWLKWTHAHWVHNFGWAIVVLTVIINATLLPLRVSSMKSALKMQKIAPQVKAIQEKFKKYKLNDPRRAEQNNELSALYKKEGVNPVGGCFPMLIQMPFLFAFYSMLGNAIELRQANFLWVHDLSSPDPMHLLPIAIIISMFLTQRLTPQAGMDPVQQQMMAVMMPVMMGVISWNLAAGLGVYWAVSNVIAIAQQVWINNTEFGRQIRDHAQARARTKKK